MMTEKQKIAIRRADAETGFPPERYAWEAEKGIRDFLETTEAHDVALASGAIATLENAVDVLRAFQRR